MGGGNGVNTLLGSEWVKHFIGRMEGGKHFIGKGRGKHILF